MKSKPLLLPLAALAAFILALLLAKTGLPEYSHRIHPLALRGASGLPGAAWFNLGAFVLPGLLLAWSGRDLRNRLDGAGWLARIGCALVQLSALAFAAQGLLPLDLETLDAGSSRLHALAWTLWWIAFVPGALLLALRARRGAGFAVLSLLAAAGVPALALLAPIAGWAGLVQRLAFALWLVWWLLAARVRSP